jgi:hypothetical protein
MKTRSFKIASLTVTLSIIFVPFTTPLSAAPVDAPVPNVLPNWAELPPPEPKATPPPPKPSQPTTLHGRAETALTTQALTVSPDQTNATQPPSSIPVRLQRTTFDPLLETPDLPSNLTLTAYSSDGSGYYLVQFRGPILPQWKEALKETGAVIHDYVPGFAYVVRMDEATANRARTLDAVRWVGLYQPAFRLSTALDDVITESSSGELARIVVRSFTGEPVYALTQQLESIGAKIHTKTNDSGGGTIFQLELPAASIPAVARLGSVAWVEPWVELRLFNEITRSPLIFDKDGVEARLGLYGAGQIVVVGDTGASTGDAATMHQDFRGRLYRGEALGTCGTWGDNHSHGTHVAGSVLGSGVMDGAVTSTHSYAGTNAGIAPEALLWAWGFCNDFSGLPADLYNDYYQVMYDDDPRVRLNTNSWGASVYGMYNTRSRETDRFIWDNRDMVVLFAASNDGTDGDSDGIVDQDSIGAPGTAKNVITIGASENYRMSGGYNPVGTCDAWGNCWPADFPADPVNSDRLSDDPSGMAAFSSRGPTDDGRLKPDVVAPGSNIVSTRYEGTSTGWGVYNASYLYMGGTSMATPLVAGGSAIVREFYSRTYGITPTAALVKATLINGAYDMTPGQYRDEVPDGSKDDVIRRPDIHQGWGRVDLFDSLVYDPPRTLWFDDDGTGLNTGEEYSVTLSVKHDMDPLRVTLVWADYPGLEAADGALINDLDLEVVAPNGRTYYGNDVIDDGLLDGDVDHTNNVEGVDLNPLAGSYTIKVKGYNIPQGPQPFALLVSGDMGDAKGIVYDATTLRGIKGARLEITLQPTNTTSVRTSGTGGYFGMPAASGTYSITAIAYGYQPNTVTATVPSSDPVQIPLTPAAPYTVEGTVTDADTGYPVRAHITVEGDPFDPPPPDDETWSDPATGAYSLTLSSGVTYTLLVESLGYHPAARAVGPLTGDATEDFALTPDLAACTAPGYQVSTLLSQGFENAAFPPTGWTAYDLDGDAGGTQWQRTTAEAHSDTASALHAFDSGAPAEDGWLETPQITLPGGGSTLGFWENIDWSGWYVKHSLWACTSGCGSPPTNYTEIVEYSNPAEDTWVERETDLSAYAGQSLYLAFRYEGEDADDWHIDDVALTACQPSGNAAILEPEYIYADGCPCTPQIHELTFINHTDLTDTVNVTYTTSPSVTVLEMPADLGAIPDGGVRPFEAVIKIDGGTPPGATVYVTVTASLSTTPAYSATAVVEKHAVMIADWEPRQDTSLATMDEAFVAAGGSLYQIGGTADGLTGLTNTLRYDPAADSWIEVTGMNTRVYIIDGDNVTDTIFILGGYDGTSAQDNVQIYNTTADSWSSGALPPRSRVAYAAVELDGALFRIGGGDVSAWGSTDDVDLYNPTANAWNNPANPADYLWQVRWPCAGEIDGQIYVAGGLDNTDTDISNAAVYSPTADSWSDAAMADAPVTLWGAGDFVKDGKLVCPGGIQDGSTSAAVWVYDPVTDNWSQQVNLNDARFRLEGDYSESGYTLGGHEPAWTPHATLERAIQCPDCECSLELEKQGPPWVYPDGRASYLIHLVNTGELNATTSLTDELPAGVDYAGNLACGGLNCWYDSGDNAVYFDGQIPPYEPLTITFDFTATAPISTWVVNIATVAYCGGNLVDTHEFHVHRPPAFTWTKQVAINGGAWQDHDAGPFPVAVDDFVHISETLTYTDTSPHFATVTEDWTGYPLELRSQAHTNGAVGWLPGGEYGWGLTLFPGASAWLSKTFQVTDTTALITITEWLLPADMPGEQRNVELVVSLPEPAWEKEVWVNGLLRTAWPFAGPITVVPSDTVDIVERVRITYTNDVTFTLNEEWSDSLELAAVHVSAGLVNWSPAGPADWIAGSVPPDTWHVLTKTFHVTSTGWLYDYVTETLTVEGADPQLDDRVVTFQHGGVCAPVSIDDLQSDDPVPLGDTMYFTAAVSGHTPVTYTWDFGDGSPEQSGVGIATTAHTYAADSTYTVTLDVENGCPSTDTTSITVTVYPLPTYYTLTVTTGSTGSGTVTPPPGTHTHLSGTTVWLTATADTGSTFAGWSGSATGMANPISVTIDGDRAVTATFTLNTYTLTVATDGTGTGSVTPPVGPYSYDYGTTVWLTATADTGSTFVSWHGAATGTANPISVTMDGDKTITATFDLLTYTLTITAVGPGTTDPPPGAYTFNFGTPVVITATVDPGAFFLGWSGGLIGNTNPETILIDGDKVVTATFTTETVYTLKVATDGAGSGTTEPPVGTHGYFSGTTVWLTATADTGSTFAGWSGSATGMANPISVTIDGDRAVTATFTLNTYTLTVATDGTGTGSVTPPVGPHSYDYGTTVWLTATADTGSTFAGWSGSVTGTANPISITIDGDRAVTATFTLNTYTLTVATDGTGTGSVTPPVGPHSYDYGTTVWLTATADPSSTFAGWSGSAMGMANPISVTMDGDKVVTATFDAQICIDLATITITGHLTGTPGLYTFATTYAPADATPPIAYLWDNGDTTSTTVRSLKGGTVTLMITATNCTAALVTDDHSIAITAYSYLPIVLRDH